MSSKFDLFAALSSLDVKTREIAAQEGINHLHTLRSLLLRAPASINCSTWIEQAAKAYDQMHRKRPTIAIVGSTGAGKTSFINAVIDEENLLPTNCMRACTATITEISFNHGQHKYRAEIEFLSRADWADELAKGFQALFGPTGKIVSDATNEDSEAGVFYSKLRAVYSQMTRSDIEESTIDSLMKHPSADILGQSESFEGDDAATFSNRLQAIIDSKDRFCKGFGGDVAYWPIIRRVKLFVKAQALSAGVTLVDLPGVQDSTPARAQIAENYKKTCSGLIVTAPVQRAADDRIAKNLLGPTFRRQVMMDGGYSTMTFVCTKADEININEVAKSPELKMEIDNLAALVAHNHGERIKVQKELDEAMPALELAERALLTACVQYDMIEDILRNARATLASLRPSTPVNINSHGKRTPSDPVNDHHQKRQAVEVGENLQPSVSSAAPKDEIESPDTSAQKSQSNGDFAHAQRDVDVAIEKSKSLRAVSSRAKAGKEQAAQRAQELKDTLYSLDASLDRLENEKRSICIKYRNRYVVDALKHDFVAGVKERDQERQQEQSPEDWDPAIPTRDYDKLGAELPVLTVSSRAYQQKMGRLVEELGIRGFIDVEDTEIPAAVRHCKQLTHAARVKNADFFLAMFSKLLNSLDLWRTNEKNGNTLSEGQQEQIQLHLQQKLAALECSFFKIVKESTHEIKQGIRTLINSHLETARALAVRKSGPTTETWAGLANPTWKAICRRKGIYANENGSHDWNEDLVAPMLEHIAPQWERAFSATLTKPLDRFCIGIRHKIKEFHRSLGTILEPHGLSVLHSFTALGLHNREYKTTLRAVASDLTDMIQGQQKDISRSFKPTITSAMLKAYSYCTNESGPGSQKRMTQHMKDHVERERSMFRTATRTVLGLLDDMTSDAKKYLKIEVAKIHEDLKRNYSSALCGDGFEDEARRDGRLRFANEVGRFLDACEGDFAAYVRQGRQAAHKPTPPASKKRESTFADSLFVDEDEDLSSEPASTEPPSIFEFDSSKVVEEDTVVKNESDDAGMSGENRASMKGLGYRKVGDHYYIDD